MEEATLLEPGHEAVPNTKSSELEGVLKYIISAFLHSARSINAANIDPSCLPSFVQFRPPFNFHCQSVPLWL